MTEGFSKNCFHIFMTGCTTACGDKLLCSVCFTDLVHPTPQQSQTHWGESWGCCYLWAGNGAERPQQSHFSVQGENDVKKVQYIPKINASCKESMHDTQHMKIHIDIIPDNRQTVTLLFIVFSHVMPWRPGGQNRHRTELQTCHISITKEEDQKHVNFEFWALLIHIQHLLEYFNY